MQEINTNYNFINEKFTINTDVYFTVDTTVIHGHRVCKLKTLKIHYHGEDFEMATGTTIYKYIINDGIRSIYSVELVNYLNRFINHENLFEVYSESKPEENNSKIRYGGRRNELIQQEITSFIIHENSNSYEFDRYKFGLISDNKFIKSELNKTRNQNYQICYSRFEDIKNTPIFCYVHQSLAVNQGSTIILCHIGYIIEKLANYHRFPEY